MYLFGADNTNILLVRQSAMIKIVFLVNDESYGTDNRTWNRGTFQRSCDIPIKIEDVLPKFTKHTE